MVLVARPARLVLLWRPARKVELHTLNLLGRASDRDWPSVGPTMAADDRDAWNTGRTSAPDEARRLFSRFFARQIVPLAPLRIGEEGNARTAGASVGIFGCRHRGIRAGRLPDLRKVGDPFRGAGIDRFHRGGSMLLPLIATMKRPPAVTLAVPDLPAVRHSPIPLRPR